MKSDSLFSFTPNATLGCRKPYVENPVFLYFQGLRHPGGYPYTIRVMPHRTAIFKGSDIFSSIRVCKYPGAYGLKEKALFIWKENSDEKDKARRNTFYR